MPSDTIRVEKGSGHATVTIDRPAKRNAMTAGTFADLRAAIEDVDRESTDVLTIRGSEGDFSAGVDMSNVPEWAEADPLEVRDGLEEVQAALDAIESLDAPVIAAVEGFVLGGGVELALACDLRIASSTAEFGFPEASLGLAMDLGGGQKLPGFVGEGRAKYLLLTGKRIDAERALEMGLVEERVPEEEFDDRIEALEGHLASQPTYALALAKRQVQAARPAHLDQERETAIYHAIAAYQEEETQQRVEDFLDR
jgi:enoyl-CoA hydratase/carnithine racemase